MSQTLAKSKQNVYIRISETYN